MKKKTIIAIIIILALILLIPIPRKLKDGGSTEYTALLYKVTKLHKITTSGYVNGWSINILGHQVYYKVNENEEKSNDEYNQKLLSCLESELGGYILTEKDDLKEIPLKEIKDNDNKIAHYKGFYASEHPKNMFVIVVEDNKMFDADVMKPFEMYFTKKNSIYQKYEIGSEGISIYISNGNNDVNFKEVQNKCMPSNLKDEDGKRIPSETLNKLSELDKIVIKSGNMELGTIQNKNILGEILNMTSNSKQYGENFLCDGNVFDFELYNGNKLIDTIYVWEDGRLIPKSIHSGCSYYSNINNDINLKKIIENETDYVFYGILDISDNCDTVEELIYSNNTYNYYLNCQKSDKVLITFDLTNQTMTLKYALNNNYISANKVHNDYPDLLIRKMQG